MQRKALKQLNKVTQWTNEKVFSGERTHFSEDFAEFEREIEPLRKGIERLHATSVPFFEQLTKLKPSADPYRPTGSKDKDKMLATEALGLVMIDYGNDAGGDYGDGLVKYGRARCKIALLQDEFGERLNDGYIQNTEAALSAVNEYKLYRKKMDSRRLTLDSALSRIKATKKDSAALEQEVELAQMRLDESEEDTKLRMMAIKEQEAAQFDSLMDLVDAELEYFTRCQEVLLDLREHFPTGYTQQPQLLKPRPPREEQKPRAHREEPKPPAPARARAKSNASSRSAGRAAAGFSGSPDSDDEDGNGSGNTRTTPKAGNRSRSDSAASAGGGKGGKGRSLMSSIGFGVKSASSKAKGSFRKKDGEALLSEDEDPQHGVHGHESPARPPNNRARSQSVVSVVTGLAAERDRDNGTPRRRAITSPSSPASTFVKVLYDFEGLEGDELPLRVGQIVEIRKQVSDDWAIGECEGMSGLFPRAYTEEHVPSPVSLPATSRRLPPSSGAAARRISPPITDDDTDADSIVSAGTDDNDKTALASAAQPPPTTRSRSSSIKKPAPPPPPSRRLTAPMGTRSPPVRSRSGTITRAPVPAGRESPSPFRNTTQSPFAHSDDEGGGAGCKICGCGEFTQNVFKAPGTCSNCFHQH